MPFSVRSLGLAIWLPVILISSLSASCATAESSGKEDTTAPITVEQADAILLELREIRSVLEKIERKNVAQPTQARQRPTNVKITIDESYPALGRKDAPVTIVEFTDYQCPFCKRFSETTFPAIKRDYIDTGKLRWVVRDLPLPMHRDARKAAQAVHCANDQGEFWGMRDTVFKNNAALGNEFLRKYAGELELDTSKFGNCLTSDRHLASIDKDTKEASQVGITGTPTFVVGKSSGVVLSGKVVSGAQPVQTFRAYIDALLKEPDEPSG